MASKKRTVLFLCTGNSARSQMAEALLNHKAGDSFDVYSAGTQPETVDERALSALAKFGVETNYLSVKNVATFEHQVFDFVITLCDKANSECRSFSGAKNQLAWDFPDPKSRLGSNAFSITLNEIDNRLSMFLLVEEKHNNTEQEQADFDVIPFYKTLTDDIRLKTLMLTHYHGELCVCELMIALTQESQPKVSRNLAVLKKANILTDRKHGQWVFYRINPDLPLWVKSVIAQTTENNIGLIKQALIRLANMKSRPSKVDFCR